MAFLHTPAQADEKHPTSGLSTSVQAGAANSASPAPKRIAVHACCGPCSLEPIAALKAEGFEPTIFWTNPNIQPIAEHDRRLQTLLSWASSQNIKVVIAADNRALWERTVAARAESGSVGLAAEDHTARCRACYALRLAETCRAAKAQGFDYVTTTLAVSPYQLFDVCSEELAAIAQAHGLTPVIRDWRSRYGEATRKSRELGMYRQNYCGCRFSAAEATLERSARRQAAKKAAKKANPQ